MLDTRVKLGWPPNLFKPWIEQFLRMELVCVKNARVFQINKTK